MPDLPELYSDLVDLPAALLVLANGGSIQEVAKAFADRRFSRDDLEPVRTAVRKNLDSLLKRGSDQVGRRAVRKLFEDKVVFEGHYEWKSGLTFRAEGSLEVEGSLDHCATYATAILADLVVREAVVFFKCDGCKKFAIKDNRGSGNLDNKDWCSARCRNANAQRVKRIRDRAARQS